MCDSATLDVDNILRQTKVLGDRNSNRRECLIYFDALYVRSFPASTFERLFNRGNGPSPNIPGSTAPTP